LKGRKIGILLGPGFDLKLRNAVVAATEKEGATAAIIAPKVGGVEDSAGTKHPAHAALRGSPSVVFDAVVVMAGPSGDSALESDPDAIAFLTDALRHLKAIGLAGVPGLAAKASVTGTHGVTEIRGTKTIPVFIDFARRGKVWEREPHGKDKE
jgi:catalase